MPAAATTGLPAFAGRRSREGRHARWSLGLLTLLAVAAGGTLLVSGGETTRDPDLLRLMRFMAAMKGAFALAAFVACLWRLARPAAPWRTGVYVAGPPLMILGACGLWVLREPGLAALGLHLGLFAVLAAALTDPDFVPDLLLLRRPGR